VLNTDLLIYPTHVAFWASFGLTRRLTHAGDAQPASPAAPAATRSETAPFSRFVLGVHMLAFGVMYAGIGQAVFPNRVPGWFTGQRAAGTAVMALGALLMSWAVASFQSWRFRAKLDEGHRLATDGPFRLLRHPIYMGLNLLALGSAIWIPTPTVWTAVILMVVGSDLRARSEEAVLTSVFGQTYIDYSRRTRRFVPGVY
jgi:protein-S-isoprenylcysteine O-methyltransferase Ste14